MLWSFLKHEDRAVSILKTSAIDRRSLTHGSPAVAMRDGQDDRYRHCTRGSASLEPSAVRASCTDADPLKTVQPSGTFTGNMLQQILLTVEVPDSRISLVRFMLLY